jgi:hypothetical protein
LIEENTSNQGKQDTQQSPGNITTSSQPLSVNDVAPKPTATEADKKPTPPRKLLVEIIRDNELSTFEQETLRLARESLDLGKRQAKLTIYAIVIAAIAAALVYGQIKEATWNNQILAAQTESAIVGALEAERNSRAQLKIAQDQANAAQDSVGAIQQQMRQDQRPWLDIHFNTPTGQSTKVNISLDTNKPLMVPLRIINSGKTAARRVQTTMFVEVVDSTKEPHLDSTHLAPWIVTTGLIVPGSPNDLLAFRQIPGKSGLEAMWNPTPDEIKNLNDGSYYVAVHGRITYIDGFNISHWTKFCFPMTSGVTHFYNYRKCTDYNDVDNK